MSRKVSLFCSIDICCPTCEEMMEIQDMDVSMTIEHCDVGSRIEECAFNIDCTDCGKTIRIDPTMEVKVWHPQ